MPREEPSQKKRPGPKPRGPFSDKRKTITLRITQATRERLEQACQESGRSLAQESELRLDRSFLDDSARHQLKNDGFGNEHNYRLAKLWGGIAAARGAEAAGTDWQAFVVTVVEWARAAKPIIEADDPETYFAGLEGFFGLGHTDKHRLREIIESLKPPSDG